jgi:transposase InsO family protein
MVWHQRLGHPSALVFQHLLRHHKIPLLGPFNKSRVCESCQLGKSKQLPFSESNRVSISPLEIIHSDVWISPVPSLSGCKFYVLFIDDYSRFTWLYPIMNKSDVFQCFVKFKLLTENLFSTKIKYFQSDNGGEYCSLQFKDFLSRHGIFHRLTCPHTSQQNGIAERKHRHIMEMGLTLLAQSGLLPKHWVDSFLTSIFLINRLPSIAINNETPFSKLFKKHPDYTFLRAFGCLCYPLLHPYAHHKLSFRSKPCIFIGYGANQRGYRCLDPQSHKVYISRSVVFDESQFPAKGMALSQGSCTITVPTGNPIVPIPSNFMHNPPSSTYPSAVLSGTHSPSPAMQTPTLQENPPTAISPLGTAILQQTHSSILQDSSPISPNTSHVVNNSAAEPIPQDTHAFPNEPTHLQSVHLQQNHAPNLHDSSPTSPNNSHVVNNSVAAPMPQDTSPIPIAPATPTHHIVTRFQTGNLKPKSFSDFKLFRAVKHPLYRLSYPCSPS